MMNTAAPRFSGISVGHASNSAGVHRVPDFYRPSVSSESRLTVQVDGRDLDALPAVLKPQQGDTVQFELKIGADHQLAFTRSGEFQDGKSVKGLSLGRRDTPLPAKDLADFTDRLLKALLPDGYHYRYPGSDERIPALQQLGGQSDHTLQRPSRPLGKGALRTAAQGFAARLKTLVDLQP